MENLYHKLNLDVAAEYRQAFHEGRDVASLESEVGAIACAYPQDKLANADRAEAMIARIKAAPVKDDFSFCEPDDYAEILKQRPTRRHSFKNTLSDDEMRDKLLGAWSARVAGCLLGKPVEGCHAPKIERMCRDSGNYPPTRYLRFADFPETTVKELEIWDKAAWADTFAGCSPIDDDIMYTVFSLYLLENRGFDFSSDDIVDGWTRTIPGVYCCTAEHIAYMNHLAGLRGEECGKYINPYREFLGAQIRTDLYAYVNPADPEKAAEMAFRDASATHERNAIYGAMFINAMISAAAVCDDVMTVIEAGLDEIPENCRLAYYVRKTVAEFKDGKTWNEMKESIHAQFDEGYFYDWCFAVPNCMIITAALLHGNGDFTKSIGLSVISGFDTDCNAASIGSVIGMMKGSAAVDKSWITPFNGKINTPVAGYNMLTLDEAADRTLALYKKLTESSGR